MGKQGDSNAEEERQRAAIRSLLETLPEKFTDRHQALLRMREIMHQEFASAMTSAVNDLVRQSPQQTSEDRSDLATSINEQLRAVGLAIRCPRTGRPAILLADWQDKRHPEKLRFRFVTRDARNRPHRSFTSPELPELELVPDSLRIEVLSRGFHRSKGENNGPAR